MPRITVSTDHGGGPVTHTEWVTPADFDTQHFRLQLAERLAWAVQDAVAAPPPAGDRHAAEPEPEPEPDREPRPARFDRPTVAA